MVLPRVGSASERTAGGGGSGVSPIVWAAYMGAKLRARRAAEASTEVVSDITGQPETQPVPAAGVVLGTAVANAGVAVSGGEDTLNQSDVADHDRVSKDGLSAETLFVAPCEKVLIHA